MNALDRNSSYIPAEGFQSMREDTEGAFEGIGVHIRMDDQGNIVVFQPVPDAPAANAGIASGDHIVGVDGVGIAEITKDALSGPEALEEVSSRIKGPRGTTVQVAVSRAVDEEGNREILSFDVKRGKIPIQSIVEARLLEGGVGYIRISDFKKNTADDIRKNIERLESEGLRSLILDLRWNPGGLLTASREVCELFLPKNSLVVSTRGREVGSGKFLDELELYTEKHPVVPETMPLIVLVNGSSASSSEIVTGALQYYERALIVGETSFGKGSVQTIIPLNRPRGAALRLTTALYYTPAGVTIDQSGIKPDVKVEMDVQTQRDLQVQMFQSYETDARLRNKQDHGAVTGSTDNEAVQDTVLQKAVDILREDILWSEIIQKYHRDVSETQVAAVDADADSAE
jgi:carboxyl-terminal processing protease